MLMPSIRTLRMLAQSTLLAALPPDLPHLVVASGGLLRQEDAAPAELQEARDASIPSSGPVDLTTLDGFSKNCRSRASGHLF